MYIIFDLIRNRGVHPLRRAAVYTFIFYLLNVFEQTTGGLSFPPWPEQYRTVAFQPVPFRFPAAWLELYRQGGPDWCYRYAVKTSLLNAVLLFPLGLYLPLLFGMRGFKKSILFLVLSSLTIELYQVVFSCTGLTVTRVFDIDDILLNTLGGLAAFVLYRRLPERWTGWIGRRIGRSSANASAEETMKDAR